VGAACASWSGDEGLAFREIVRQQWNFSPPKSIREVEKYRGELFGVTVLELVIVPDISRGTTRASLMRLRLG
jgi:hypothetical protein